MPTIKEEILKVALECNCRAEHGAEGGAHLLAIERMLREIYKKMPDEPVGPSITDQSIMPFGKHKGMKLEDVPAGYLLWLDEQENFAKNNAALHAYIQKNQIHFFFP